MGKYLKKFESHSQYEAYAASPAFLCPNVSICVNEKDVHYTQFIHVSSVTLNKNELTLPQDETDTLVASVLPSNASNKNVTYSSSNDRIATVNSYGVVSGVGVGNTTITVTTEDGGFTAQCDISVKNYKVITYTATAKLPEMASFSKGGLHPSVFSGTSGQQLTMVSHTFEDGAGTITFNGDIVSAGQRAFYYSTGLTSINIPDCVTSIDYDAFSGCTSLTSIDIPSGVTSIGDRFFKYCSGLTSITIQATTPPTLGTEVFNNTNNCPIYVPSESVDTYVAASGWSTYASRIQAIP